jgi:phage baseplate assembly protein W
MTQINYPLSFDSRGRTAQAEDEKHIRDLIEQVLFTSPGERINRPTFGSGMMQLVFAPNSEEQATAIQFLVQGALQQWLGDRITTESVDIRVEDSTLEVTVKYVTRRNQQRSIAEFSRGI